MELDRFDRRLLNLVQEDAAQTAERLAEQVNLSPSAVQRRLRRMREQGVIVRDAAIVDPKKAGGLMTFVVTLVVERDHPESLSPLRAWLAGEESVQEAFYVTGEAADFILVVTAPSTEAYDALMSRMVKANPTVKRYTTHVALTIVKRGLKIPIPPDE